MNKPETIYLDHNATTPLAEEAREAMDRISREFWANPSSSHKAGKKAKDALEDSRETVARLLAVRPEEIIFTSGGTESNNLALKGLADIRPEGKDHIVTSLTEHSSVHEPLLWLASRGCRVTRIKPDRLGRIDPLLVGEAIDEKTFLVSILMANNETGTIQDTESIGRICAERSVLFHTDGVQAVGKIPLRINREEIGLFSASAHKFGGPRGIGFLCKNRGIRLTPLLHGGGQERGLRSGTESPGLAAGMAAALALALARMPENSPRLKSLTAEFWSSLKKEFPFAELNGDPENRVPNTLNIRFPGVSGPKIVSSLEEEGIYLSPSSACSSSSGKPSRILTALGLMADEAYSSLRFSFGYESRESDIPRILSALSRAIED